jgi:hypothetical protein
MEIPYDIYANNWQPASSTNLDAEVGMEDELDALSEYEDGGMWSDFL